MNKQALKSTGTVLAGLGTIVVLSNGTDVLLESTGILPPALVQRQEGFTTGWMVGLALGYRTAYLVVGGYVTARLARRRRPRAHVLVLGLVGTVLGGLGSIAAWGITPAWFSVATVVLGLPSVWLGGWLAERTGGRAASRDPRPASAIGRGIAGGSSI